MIDLDALAELHAWLLKRAQPNSGLRYERYGDGLARVELYGADATFVADHFHSKGAKTLADAIDLVRRAAIPSEQGEAVAWVFELAHARHKQTGEWMHFGPPQLSFTKPNVPDGSILNLHPLGYIQPAPAAGVKVKALPNDNDGVEQDAFEEWAKAEGFDMEQHPLHWLFLNKQTSAAREGWRAALRHAHARILSALDQGEPK